jgi:hypothetical protein
MPGILRGQFDRSGDGREEQVAVRHHGVAETWSCQLASSNELLL